METLVITKHGDSLKFLANCFRESSKRFKSQIVKIDPNFSAFWGILVVNTTQDNTTPLQLPIKDQLNFRAEVTFIFKTTSWPIF